MDVLIQIYQKYALMFWKKLQDVGLDLQEV